MCSCPQPSSGIFLLSFLLNYSLLFFYKFFNSGHYLLQLCMRSGFLVLSLSPGQAPCASCYLSGVALPHCCSPACTMVPGQLQQQHQGRSPALCRSKVLSSVLLPLSWIPAGAQWPTCLCAFQELLMAQDTDRLWACHSAARSRTSATLADRGGTFQRPRAPPNTGGQLPVPGMMSTL